MKMKANGGNDQTDSGGPSAARKKQKRRPSFSERIKNSALKIQAAKEKQLKELGRELEVVVEDSAPPRQGKGGSADGEARDPSVATTEGSDDFNVSALTLGSYAGTVAKSVTTDNSDSYIGTVVNNGSEGRSKKDKVDDDLKDDGDEILQRQMRSLLRTAPGRSPSSFSIKINEIMMEAARRRSEREGSDDGRVEHEQDDDHGDDKDDGTGDDDSDDDDDDDDDDNSRSIGSTPSRSSASTARSALSEKIAAASRRGSERADSRRSLDGRSPRGEGGSERPRHRKYSRSVSDGHLLRDKGESGKHRHDRKGGRKERKSKKKKKKKKKNSKRQEQGQFVVQKGAKIMNLTNLDGDERFGDMPRTTEPLRMSAVDLNYRRGSIDSGALTMMSTDDSSSGGSRGMSRADSFGGSFNLPSHKYHDKRHLSEAAHSKFQKGLHCTKRERYSLARTKFRAALKARILLHEDTTHLSIAPVHEMIGMVERTLGQYEKAQIHLEAALEVCKGALEDFDKMAIDRKKDFERRMPCSAEQPSKEEDQGSESEDENGSSSQSNKHDDQRHIASINDDQRQLLLINIERILKTIAAVENDAEKQRLKEAEKGKEVDGCKSILKTDNDADEDDANGNSTAASSRMSTAAADGKLKLARDSTSSGAMVEEGGRSTAMEKIRAWESKMARNENTHAETRHVVGNLTEREQEEESLDEEDDADADGDDDDDDELPVRHMYACKASFASRLSLDSIIEESGSSDQTEKFETKQWQKSLSSEEESSSEEDEQPFSTKPIQYLQPKCQELPKAKLGVKRLSSSSDRLRDTYQTHNEAGEEHFNREQYDMAIACFNDAKFALLIIAGMPVRRSKADRSGAVYAKLRDQINSALLSERITDCHVRKYSSGTLQIEMVGDDISPINYRQAATMVTETKKSLMKQIELEEKDENASIVDALNDLLNVATLSLARIFSKQGCVYAKLNYQCMALDFFSDSIAAWEEAAVKNLQGNNHGHLDVIAVNYDPLVLETQEAISSYYEQTNGVSRLSQSAHSLKNTTHLEALSTALQMARSHHALGVEAVTARDMPQFKAAVHHHLNALKLTRETEHLRTAFNASVLGRQKSDREAVGSAMSIASGGRRMTTRARDFSEVMSRSDSMDIAENGGQFVKGCTLLATQQQICISHASYCAGFRMLSTKWLLKAVASMDSLDISNMKEEARVTMYIISVITKGAVASEGKTMPVRLVDRFSLYESGLPAFTEGFKEKPRILIHFAMAALRKGLHMDAMGIFNRATAKICNSRNPPSYHQEVLDALNAQIIIQLKEGDMAGAAQQMNRRLDIVTSWMGTSSLARAKDLHRLGCFYSLLGHHGKCAKYLDDSLRIGSEHDDYDILDCSKLLATTHDALNDTEEAISEYENVLGMENDATNKAKLMNALSDLHIRNRQSHIAIDYLEKSLKIQQDYVNNKDSEDGELILETMILYGSVMASKKYFSQAIHWYESALNSNPDKSAIHPSNLRAWYNKGVTLFRSGDMNGAAHAFEIIMDEVENNYTIPSGTALVLNAIGNFYFSIKDYAAACQQFSKSLSLKNDDLSPSQRAGTLCNIATAYYMMGNYEESEVNFKKALMETESSDHESSTLKATIMCRVAYILFKRKLYRDAYHLYTKAALMGNENDLDDDFNDRCNGCAEMCRLRLIDQNYKQKVPPQKQGVIAQKPRLLSSSLTPITDAKNTSRCSNAVYSRQRKIFAALGVELSNHDLIALPLEGTKTVCDRALEYLLQQTEDYRAKYASEFNEMLVEKVNFKFKKIKSFFDKECETIIVDA